MDAIVQAVRLGRGAQGEIWIHDPAGKVVDVLPLPNEGSPHTMNCGPLT